MRVIVHNQLQYGHRTVLKGVRQVKHARNCGALSGQCLLSFCDSNGPIVFEQPQIQNIKWPAGRGDTTCAVGFGGASQAEIINGTFTDNDIGSVLRVFGNSSVTITGTRIKAGTGGITAGAVECIYQHLWMPLYQLPGSGSLSSSCCEPHGAKLHALGNSCCLLCRIAQLMVQATK